jgi:hypothetical protein
VLLLLASRAAVGQLTTADILGTVTDTSGAVIPNAHVNLTDLDTQEKRSTVSNVSGDYSFTLLRPGHYSVTVQTSGFKVSTTPNLAVEGDRARADVRMELGSADQTVTVELPCTRAANPSPSSTTALQAGSANRASPQFNGGVDRPNQIHAATLSHPTLTRFFDTTAFVPQTLGTVGSEARNPLYGPHFRHLDLSVFKNFQLTER